MFRLLISESRADTVTLTDFHKNLIRKKRKSKNKMKRMSKEVRIINYITVNIYYVEAHMFFICFDNWIQFVISERHILMKNDFYRSFGRLSGNLVIWGHSLMTSIKNEIFISSPLHSHKIVTDFKKFNKGPLNFGHRKWMKKGSVVVNFYTHSPVTKTVKN